MSGTWLTGAGSFWILGLAFLGSSIFFSIVSLQLGKHIRSPGDGCLLALCNILFVVVGGMIGYRLFAFPYCIPACVAGTLFAPALITAGWIHRTLGRRVP